VIVKLPTRSLTRLASSLDRSEKGDLGRGLSLWLAPIKDWGPVPPGHRKRFFNIDLGQGRPGPDKAEQCRAGMASLMTRDGLTHHKGWPHSSQGMALLITRDGLTHHKGWPHSSQGMALLITRNGLTHHEEWPHSSQGIASLITRDGLTHHKEWPHSSQGMASLITRNGLTHHKEWPHSSQGMASLIIRDGLTAEVQAGQGRAGSHR
jgi:hypothetical protein